MIGQKFNYFTVISEVEPWRDNRGHIKHRMYQVRCVCGTEKVHAKCKIVSGHYKSCGCKLKEKIALAQEKKKLYRDSVEKRKVERKERSLNRVDTQKQKYWADPEYRARVNNRRKQHKLDNPDIWQAKKKRRRGAEYTSTPQWLSDNDKKLMKEAYAKAKVLTTETGIRHEVDHIIPLQGENVCGLHVPWNLRVVTALENRSKGYKLIANL